MKPAICIGYATLALILFSSKVVECITCLNCKNIEDLGSCKELFNCKEDEVCYIDKVLSLATFAPQYNTGCKKMEFCKLEFCNKKAYGDGNSIRKRATGEDLTMCSECCYEDGCNAEGCGYKHPQNNNTQCFNCKEVYEGGPTCTDTVDCDLNLFACSVMNRLGSIHPGAYGLGCHFKRSQCDTLMSLEQQDKNVKCCDTTLCNSSPYNSQVNKTAIAMDFDCPTEIARPTTTPALPKTLPTTGRSAATTATTATTTTTAGLPNCQQHIQARVQPQNLVQNGNKCYEYVPKADSWMHAREYCHSKNGHMLSIGNAEEQSFIYNMLTKTQFTKKLWLGLDDRVNEGQWKWDSGDIMNYTHWAPGRYVDPYHDQEDCAIMVMFRYGQWDDVDCNALVHGKYVSYPWICQYNKGSQGPGVTSTVPDKSTQGSNVTPTVPASWSSWFSGACSATCGTGSSSRLRRCSTGHEDDCAGKAVEIVTCDAGPCPIDGSWGVWQHWGTCSSTCGYGTKIRIRECDSPAPNYGGMNCNGERKDNSTCNIIDCPHWLPFYQASPCSVTCGVGFIQLKRNCSSGHRHDCHGSEYSEKSCNLISCS